MADVNGDGVVNSADLQALLLEVRAGGVAAEPVPEPSAAMLLALGGIGLWARRRRVAAMAYARL